MDRIAHKPVYCTFCGSSNIESIVNFNDDFDYAFKKTIYGTITYETKCYVCKLEFEMIEKVKPEEPELKPNDPQVNYVKYKCVKCGYHVNRIYGGVGNAEGFICYFCKTDMPPVYRPRDWGVEKL